MNSLIVTLHLDMWIKLYNKIIINQKVSTIVKRLELQIEIIQIIIMNK